jgi:hypothetical protein
MHQMSSGAVTFGISTESPKIPKMYGIGNPETDDYGRRLLMARRLVEKGVRFVCLSPEALLHVGGRGRHQGRPGDRSC